MASPLCVFGLGFLGLLGFLSFWGGLLWGFDFDFLVSFCFWLLFSLVFFVIFVIFCDFDFDCCCILYSSLKLCTT